VARLAPVYDLVTTTVYMAKDRMALTLNGTTAWPDSKALARFGETRMMGTPSQVRQVLGRVAEAMDATATELRSYIKEHRDFSEVGKAMLQEWENGRRTSLMSR